MSNAPTTPQSRTLKTLWRAVFWVSFPFGILSFVLPIYGKELGASALEVGVFFSAFSLVPVIVRPFLGRAMDRWGRRPFLLLGLLGYAVAMLVFCVADTVWLLTVARFGLYTFAHFLGAALGPLAGGWLYDNLGHAMPFYLNTAVMLVGALLVAVVLREPHAVE